jgi:hypothetical protein
MSVGDPFGPLRDLIRRFADEARPIRLATVVDTSLWSPVGASYVTVEFGGAQRIAIYRDGPEPPLGSPLQILKMAPGSVADYLALPLPQGCAGMLYVSARRLSDDTWHILRCDLAAGNTWQYRSASPVAGAFPRRPVHGYLGTRLFTWGSSADLATPGPLHYSDDGGLTWASAGASVANLAMQPRGGVAYAVGGGDVLASYDQGASWGVAGSPGGTCYAVATNQSSLDFSISLLTSAGYYTATSFGGVVSPFDGPFGAGGQGAWVTNTTAGNGEYFTGGTTYSAAGSTVTAVGSLAGGDDSPGRQYGATGAGIYHAATGDGHVYVSAQYPVPTVVYDPATDHPAGTAGVGANDAYLVTGVQPYVDGVPALCLAIALQDIAGGPKLIARDPEATGAPWAVVSGGMAAALGGEGVISVQGLAALERWGANEA